MRLWVRRGKFILLLSLLYFLALSAQAQVNVRLYDVVYVPGGRVILGEVAELKGDPTVVQRIADLQIGPVLKLREVRIVTVEDLKQAIPKDVQVDFSGAPAVEVHPLEIPNVHCGISYDGMKPFEDHDFTLPAQADIQLSVCHLWINGTTNHPLEFHRRERNTCTC